MPNPYEFCATTLGSAVLASELVEPREIRCIPSSAVPARLLVFTTRRSVRGRSRAKPEQSCCSLPMFRSICGLGGAELLRESVSKSS
jgi:hypothetical protein